MPGFDLSVMRRVDVVEHRIGDLDGEFAALSHGVARVDREVQHRGLKLRRIDSRMPQTAGDDAFDDNGFADRPPDQRQCLGHEIAEVDDFRLQGLAASEG